MTLPEFTFEPVYVSDPERSYASTYMANKAPEHLSEENVAWQKVLKRLTDRGYAKGDGGYMMMPLYGKKEHGIRTTNGYNFIGWPFGEQAVSNLGSYDYQALAAMSDAEFDAFLRSPANVTSLFKGVPNSYGAAMNPAFVPWKFTNYDNQDEALRDYLKWTLNTGYHDDNKTLGEKRRLNETRPELLNWKGKMYYSANKHTTPPEVNGWKMFENLKRK